MSAVVGELAPDFTLPDQDNNPVSVASLRGEKALIVFIPFPFTGICQGELCAIRDSYSELTDLGARVVAITCDTRHANRRWSEDNRFQFPILSDYWPHGKTCQSYGCFNEATGGSFRWSFILDQRGIVRHIIKSEALSQPREYEKYKRALASL